MQEKETEVTCTGQPACWFEHFIPTKPTQTHRRSQQRAEPLNYLYPVVVFQISWATLAGSGYRLSSLL